MSSSLPYLRYPVVAVDLGLIVALDQPDLTLLRALRIDPDQAECRWRQLRDPLADGTVGLEFALDELAVLAPVPVERNQLLDTLLWSLRPVECTVAMVDALVPNHVTVHPVADHCARLWVALRDRWPQLRRLPDATSSSQVGVRLPNPAVLSRLAHVTDRSAGSILYVDAEPARLAAAAGGGHDTVDGSDPQWHVEVFELCVTSWR